MFKYLFCGLRKSLFLGDLRVRNPNRFEKNGFFQYSISIEGIFFIETRPAAIIAELTKTAIICPIESKAIAKPSRKKIVPP